LELVQALSDLGLKPGDDVLVHSSLSSIGWVDGGAPTVVAALIEAVAPGGTVLFPGLTGSVADSVENPPRADLRKDPVSWVGKIPAAANARGDSRRSLHPTHSVIAIGARADYWTEGHERCETPCGEGSPYHRLAVEGGCILLLGCDQESNTSLHMIEEIRRLPYHLHDGIAEGVVIDREGKEYRVLTRLHRWGVPRVFDRMDPALDVCGAQQRGKVGEATCRLIDATANFHVGIVMLAEDPEAFRTLPAES